MQQAQTVQGRSATPWIALVLAVLVAGVVVLGVQLAVRGGSTTKVTGPAIQTQVDTGADLQKAGLSKGGIGRIGGYGDAPLWSGPHGIREPLTKAQAEQIEKLLRPTPTKNFFPTMAREGLVVSPGR